MQKTLEDIESEIRWGTFEGLHKYRRTNSVSTTGAALVQLMEHPDYLIPGSNIHGCIKLLQGFNANHSLIKAIEHSFAVSNLKAVSKRQYMVRFRKYLPQWKEELRLQVSSKGDIAPDREAFTSGEVNAILWAFQQHHYLPYIQFSLLTGCRPAEAYGIRPCDIDLDARKIRFAESLQNRKRKTTKTGKTRQFPINDELFILLTKLLNNFDSSHAQNELFVQTNGEPMTARNFIQVWERQLFASNIRYRPPYTMRHTFISNCLRKGIPVPTVAQWVGNTPEIIWRHYATYISTETVPEMYG